MMHVYGETLWGIDPVRSSPRVGGDGSPPQQHIHPEQGQLGMLWTYGDTLLHVPDCTVLNIRSSCG